jgi:hypothetical protein
MNVAPDVLLRTIYVGNTQSISDEQLREYLQRFAPIEKIFHQCQSLDDLWLIDYRFVQFQASADISIFRSNQVDHLICRTRLDIHPYGDID